MEEPPASDPERETAMENMLLLIRSLSADQISHLTGMIQLVPNYP